MKTLLNKAMIALVLLVATSIQAQINNAKTETVTIYGNCGMCEAKIEKAGNIKKVAQVDWDQETQMATLTYDATKTNSDEILKRIALVGYDSDKFLAPDDAYSKLPKCCHYDRVAKTSVKETTMEDHSNHANHQDMILSETTKNKELQTVFNTYFSVKDALVTSDVSATTTVAKELVTAINNVKMDQLETDVHRVWMKVFKQLKDDASQIANAKDIKKQRYHFVTLSKEMYLLIKVAKYDETVYYQHCPMANDGKGANWLSKENEVKNPYYGSKMLTCGKTVETLK
jgi:copper chaperone CopZ